MSITRVWGGRSAVRAVVSIVVLCSMLASGGALAGHLHAGSSYNSSDLYAGSSYNSSSVGAGTMPAALVASTIPVGSDPTDVVYDSGRGEVFVMNAVSNTVSVINDTTDLVVASITVGGIPQAAVYDSGKGEVFIENGSSNGGYPYLSVISDATDTVTTTVYLEGSGADAMAYDRAAGEIVLCVPEVGVVGMNDTTYAFTSLGGGDSAVGVAVDPALSEIFVTNYGAAGTVSVIGASSGTAVATIPVGSNPIGVAYDSAKAEVFVANSGTYTLSVISTATNKVVANVTVGAAYQTPTPTGVAYDGAIGELFVTNNEANDVAIVSDTTDTVTATLGVGSSPSGVAYDSAKGEVFVANSDSNDVSVFTPGAIIYTVFFGTTPANCSITFAGKSYASGTNNSSVLEGTYSIVANACSGETFDFWGDGSGNVKSPTSSSTTVVINASDQGVSAVYTSSGSPSGTPPGSGSPSSSSGLSTFDYVIIAVLVVAVLVIVAGGARRRRRRKASVAPPTPSREAGPGVPPPPP